MEKFKCPHDGGEVKQSATGVWEWECSGCGLQFGIGVRPSTDPNLHFVRLVTWRQGSTPRNFRCPTCNEELLAAVSWQGLLVWPCAHCGKFGVATATESQQRGLMRLDEQGLLVFLKSTEEKGR